MSISQSNAAQSMQYMYHYMQHQMQQQQQQAYTTGQVGTERIFTNQGGYDYVGDNIFGQNSEYASGDIATMFNAMTGQNFTAEQIEQQFGKERITDYDLYSMVENSTTKDGYLNPAEILNFMASSSTEEASFEYFNDGETSYSLEDVAEKIRQQTGKIIDPADLSTLVSGRTEMTNFEVMMLLDRNRDGKADSVEMNNLISGFQIEYDLDDDDVTGTEDDAKSLYRGDGVWSYSVEDFKTRASEELNIALTDDQITGVLGTSIDDRVISQALDTDNDGYISTSELSEVFGVGTETPQDINYIGDDTAVYSLEQVAGLLSQAIGGDVTEGDVQTLTGGETAITDQMMFNMFDTNKNGTVEVSEAEALVAGSATEASFDYLADQATSYSSTELAAEISQFGTDINAGDIENIFGSDVITDANILATLDQTNAETGLKDGRITLEDF